MFRAYINFLKGYVDFVGRSTRPEYWWVWLMNNIFCIPLYIIYFQMILNDGKEIDPISGVAILSLYIILFMVLFIPSLALKVRRLRDAGLHWAFIFLHFVPMVGRFALLVLLAMPSKEVEIVTINRSKEVESEEVSPFE
ncbi:DUF805 domain-containing protein [Streptococcus pseudopneumoniae]|uniref:DUF805 domain-containing protein n=1 Tax=Streptococcus TaxID=1301 RepID=UPI00066BAE3E|nr:DUF805 domain-containing protein [Streptococcus pseudopneumoniae]